jgi:ABC-type multidrug transport system fused ATPase/permease subunit
LAPLGLSTLFRTVALAAGIALSGLAAWAVLGLAGTFLPDKDSAAAGVPATGASVQISSVVTALAVLSLVKGFARYLEQYFGHYVAFRALAQIRLYFYDRLAPQAPAAVEGRDTGDLLNRVTKDVDRVEVFFAHTVGPAITACLVPVATLACLALAVTPWAVPVLATGLLLAGVAVPALRRGTSAKAARRLRVARGTVASHVRDSVQGVREVLAFDYQDRRRAQLAALGQPLSLSLKQLGDVTALRRGLNLAVTALTLLAQLVVLDAAGVSTAALGLGLGITAAAFAPVLAVEDFTADLQQAYASARRIFEVTDALPLVPDSAATAPGAASADSAVDAGSVATHERSGKAGKAGENGKAEDTDGGPPASATALAQATSSLVENGAGWAPEVRFDHVTFRYPGANRSAAALSDVTLTAKAGQVTAITGASGSGKSTLAALLTRSWDPEKGQITLDGRPLGSWPLKGLRALVAVSPQRPYLFNQSIRDNLALARPEATAAELEHAASAARLDAVIASKEQGWDAPAGEMGELLSGGERQRLALARTLLRSPAVLVLDEATSQLDAVTEAEVLAGLRWAAAGRTVLLTAHRLSLTREADMVYVMDAGRVVQQGTYGELAACPGPFADLLDREGQTRPGAIKT